MDIGKWLLDLKCLMGVSIGRSRPANREIRSAATAGWLFMARYQPDLSLDKTLAEVSMIDLNLNSSMVHLTGAY